MSPLRSVVEEIQNVPWFNELTLFQSERLAKISTVRQVQVAEELFREGDRADFLYVILAGQILIENYIPSMGKQGVMYAEPLDVIGWSCLTPMVRQRIGTARVSKAGRLLQIEGEPLIKLCDEDHDLGFLVMRRVANIVASQYLSNRLFLYDIIQNSGHHSLAQSNLF